MIDELYAEEEIFDESLTSLSRSCVAWRVTLAEFRKRQEFVGACGSSPGGREEVDSVNKENW